MPITKEKTSQNRKSRERAALVFTRGCLLFSRHRSLGAPGGKKKAQNPGGWGVVRETEGG